MKNTFKLSFVSKLLIMVMGSLLLVVLQSAVQYNIAVSKIKESIKQDLLDTTNALSHSIAAMFFERYGDVAVLAHNPVFRGRDSDAMVEVLNHTVGSYGIYDMILVLNPNGRLVAVNTKRADGQLLETEFLKTLDFSKAPWFKAALQGEFTNDPEHGLTGTYVGAPNFETFIEKAYGQLRYVNAFSTVVKNESGGVRYVVVDFANFRWLADEIRSTYSALSKDGIQGSEIAVIDQYGMVLFEHDPKAHTNGKNDLFIDLETFNKVNLLDIGVVGVKNLLAGESGIVVAQHVQKNSLTVGAFAPINDGKMARVIKWGILLRAPEAELMAAVNQSLYVFYISLGLGLAVLGLASYLVLRRLGNQFTKITSSIEVSVQATRKVSDELNESSSDQSACASEQSSAIQESASALSEMSSMILQTATNTKASLAKAQDVAERSNSGREIMAKLLKSMHAIESANASLQDIGRIINDINVKTGVINSIVFKTQLLSFNASIEAARAGQYGRGFAVVAEEVGNLAQMSGSAAREIETLLTDSQKQVAMTLDSIRQRVKESNVVSDEAGRTFNEIATAIDSIASQVKNIAEATEQQNVGVEQTQKAMGQLDIVARKNYQMSQATMRVADEMNSTSKALSLATVDLSQIIFGRTGGESNVVSKPQPLEKIPDPAVEVLADVVPLKPTMASENGISADDESFKKAA